MRRAHWQGLVAGIAAALTALPACANRLTFEVRPDPSPDHAVFCSFALEDDWISLIQVRGPGLPTQQPIRWRATRQEDAAILSALQAFVAGDTTSVDAYSSRPPPAPFVTVTWMTSLDGSLATGVFIQPGLRLPEVLAQSLSSLGLVRACGLSAKASE
jgi:hypothetical protein